MISIDSATVIAGKRAIVDEVSLTISEPGVTALIGPNGAGKSTLFSVVSGDIAPTHGSVQLKGKPVGDYTAKELARVRAVLPQDHTIRFAYAVEETVALARLPYPMDKVADQGIIDASLAAADMVSMRRRDVQTLSGGELARAGFARVLAQTTPILLLDEPTAALDLKHQETVLRQAQRLAEQGSAVVMVLHDLNLAAAYANRIVVLSEGRIAADGDPRSVLTAELIERVYKQRVLVAEHPTRDCPLIVTVD